MILIMNKSKKIWIINQYAGSPIHGMEYRHYNLAKEFVNLGHDVTIITASYSHLYSNQPQVKKQFTVEILDGIRYCWIKTPDYKKSISLGRLKSMVIFAIKLRKVPSILKTKPDSIIVSSPSPFPVILVNKWALKFKSKFIFEVRDIWPLTLQELGNHKKSNPLIMILSFFEKFACRKADYVVSLLPDSQSHFEKAGMKPEKFHYIPNGIEIADNKSESKNISKIEIPKNKLVVGYMGSMGASNALEYYIEAINLLKDNSDISFVFFGKGSDKEKLQQKTVNKNVFWFNPVPKSKVQNILEKFDVCYLGWHNKELYKMGISANKIFEYMLASKPIIHSNNASNDLIEIANCGISVPAENPKEISKAILQMLEMSQEERNKMGQNAKEFVLKYHTYKKIAFDYLKLMK